MYKRYMLTGLGFVFLFIIYFFTLFPVLVIRNNLEQAHFLIAVIVWAVLAAIFFLPATAMIIKKAWFFNGQGEPVMLDLIKSQLLRVNEFDNPLKIIKKRKKFVATWRLDDQNWCERIEKKKMKTVFELRLKFDNNTKTVTMSDWYRSVNWDLSPITVEKGWFVYSKPYFKVTIGNEWGVENYEDTAPEDYNFTPEEIKSPILNTILKNGWNVRFTLF